MFDILPTQGFDINMDSEEIKADTETYRHVERKIMLGALDSQFKKTHITLEVQNVYQIESNMEWGLLCTAECGGGIIKHIKGGRVYGI